MVLKMNVLDINNSYLFLFYIVEKYRYLNWFPQLYIKTLKTYFIRTFFIYHFYFIILFYFLRKIPKCPNVRWFLIGLKKITHF